ncbi:MAG: hypothetical protein MUC90_01730 [Thermoplasmata archaeon]|nr:hypothetical protein [Thermoplasmata archaeon]
MGKKCIVSIVIMLAMVGSVFGAAMTNVSANKSASDSYGYYWVDSKAPTPSVLFNWIEINTTGTSTGMLGDDTYTGPFNIGFNFEFYENTYSQFYASSNGFISFGYGSSSLSNDPIPDWSSPNNIICAYWDDMYLSSGNNAAVYYQTFGASPDMYLVVQYTNITRLGYSQLMTFEIILYENGDILVQYLYLNGMTGSSATAGIEDANGEIGLQYCYDQALLQDSLAILYTMGPIVLGPDQALSGAPSETISYTIDVWNRQSVADTIELRYTNVLGWTVDLMDATYAPLTDTNAYDMWDTGLLGPNAHFTVIVNVTIPASPAGQTEVTTMNASSAASPSLGDLCELTTTVQNGWFEPPHSDYGRDTDGDSLYNYLVVDVDLGIIVEGWYYIEAYLYTGGGTLISSDYASAYLTVGPQTVEMTFFGWQIRDMGVDGPYRVDLNLYYNWAWPAIDTDTHWTAAYSYTEFMLIPATFSPPHSDHGVDADSDSLYDMLQVDVSLDVVYDGTYTVNAYAYGREYIGYDSQTVSLVAGEQTVSLTFDAWDIYTLGGDGPYTIYLNLYALIDSVSQFVESDTHYTQAYSVYSFEGPGAYFWPPHSDYAVDTDSDGLYNWLVIEVQVNVTVAGTYTLVGDIRADWWQDIFDTVMNESMSLQVGIQTVNLTFPGWPIRYNSDSDDMDIEMTLYDADYEYQDYDEYETDTYYYYDDFEDAPALFSPPHDSYVVDLNGDSLYDFIIVNVSVDIELAGMYRIYADLYLDWWDVIDDVENESWLDEGLQVVELRFPGWVIRDHGDSGPYTVEMILYDDEDRQCDWDSHTTAAYLWSEFQTQPAAFAPPHNDYGEDTDSDSLYEWLVIEVNLTVAVAGDYLIMTWLYDSGWSEVTQTEDWFTLAEGSVTALVKYPAWVLFLNDANGVFHVEMYLYDESENYLEYNAHTTASYLMTDFDPGMPQIEAGWANASPSINGMFSAGEWADATAVDLTSADHANQVEGTVYVMNDETNLYIAVDAWGDTYEDSSDESSVSFDTGNDGVETDGGEDQFTLAAWSPDTGTHYEWDEGSAWWVTHCSPFDDAQADHETLEGSVGFGPSAGHAVSHRIYEYSIPLTLLGAEAGDTLGFLLGGVSSAGIYEWDYGYESWWPMYFDWMPGLESFGDLLLADYVAPTPPTTTVSLTGTAGSNGWYRSGVTVTITATSPVGVDHTNYSMDGGAWTTYTAPFSVTADGSHSIQYYSVDTADLKEATKTGAIKIDTVVPTTAADVSGANVWLNGTDATSGIQFTMYRIDEGSWETYSGMFEVTGVGDHTVEFYSVDMAGNTGVTQSTTVTVEEDDDGTPGGGISSDTLILLLVLVAAIVAALVIVFLLMKRKKGQSPAGPDQMVPPPPMP